MNSQISHIFRLQTKCHSYIKSKLTLINPFTFQNHSDKVIVEKYNDCICQNIFLTITVSLFNADHNKCRMYCD